MILCGPTCTNTDHSLVAFKELTGLTNKNQAFKAISWMYYVNNAAILYALYIPLALVSMVIEG